MFTLKLQQNEKVIKLFRQTEMVLAKHALIIFAAIYLPWFFLLKYELDYKFRSVLFIWTMLVFLYASYKYILWFLNVYILTNQRVVHVNYHTLFRKTVTETPLSHIANIGFSTGNVLQALFKTGNINVQITGVSQPLVLKNVRFPEKTKDFMWQMRARYGNTGVAGLT
jgi:hypothetical protein